MQSAGSSSSYNIPSVFRSSYHFGCLKFIVKELPAVETWLLNESPADGLCLSSFYCSWGFRQGQYVCWGLLSSLNVSIPVWLWFQLCRWGQGPACPVLLTAGIWVPLACGPFSTAVSLCHWVTQAVTDCSQQQSNTTLNVPIPCCCTGRVLQVTLKRSLSAATVYSCAVHLVPIRKLAVAHKGRALVSVWWYSGGSQLMISPAGLKRSSYMCFCAYLKDICFPECSINRGSCTFSTSLTALSLFNSR